MTYQPVNAKNAFLQTSESFTNVDLPVKLSEIFTKIATAVNIRDISQYDEVEVVNGQQFFTPSNPQKKRLAYRKAINFGALPNTGSKSVAHGITINSNTIFTRIYATATEPSTSFIPIPYAGTDEIEISVDSTNVTITTTSNRSAYTVCIVVLEYLKS